MKVFLVEDDTALSDAVCSYLRQDGYSCECAATFMSATDHLLFHFYDVVLIDITLPGGNGLDLIKTLKEQRPETGVIILSARNSLDDKLRGLDLGGDDYLTKPFHLAELNARIKALIRRRTFEGKAAIEFHEIAVQPTDMTVTVHGSPMELTKKEFDLLLFFISNKNRVLTKDAIATHLWGEQVDEASSYHFIYTHIKNLRKKLSEKGSGDYLRSMYGSGYKFSDR
jgi:DNA-binding response OmpR family regulator